MLPGGEIQVVQVREPFVAVIAEAKVHTCYNFRNVEGHGMVRFPRELQTRIRGT